jgi:hypothetical protein
MRWKSHWRRVFELKPATAKVSMNSSITSPTQNKRLADGVEHAGVIHPRIGGEALIHEDQRGDIMQAALALDVEALVGRVTAAQAT